MFSIYLDITTTNSLPQIDRRSDEVLRNTFFHNLIITQYLENSSHVLKRKDFPQETLKNCDKLILIGTTKAI